MIFLFEKYRSWSLIIISSLLYVYFGYFLERTDFYTLLILWVSLFICYVFLLREKPYSFSKWVGIFILFRMVLLMAIPNLSQDFYRFIWDGRLLFEGLNPYLTNPKDFINNSVTVIAQSKELIEGMGSLSAGNYTNYPPLHQAAFWLAAVFGQDSILDSVIVMRILIVLADIGILFIGRKLLALVKLPKDLIFWYLLNPFIILEYTGNLHFESLMLFFLLTSIYLLFLNKWIWSSLVMACAISVKLIPLLFIPLLFTWFVKEPLHRKKGLLGLSKLLAYSILVLMVNAVLFAPFYSFTMLQNYSESIGLWLGVFEFNASFYYLFREIGYWFRGYNEIAIISKIISTLSFVFILMISFFRKNDSPKRLLTAFLFAISFYYFMSTTVHPWYIGTLVLLAIFTKYRFPFVWSFVLVFSYASYGANTFHENPWWLLLEYVLVYGTLSYEIFIKKSKSDQLTT